MSTSSPFWDTDPFRFGQRYRTVVRADGRQKAIPVPLTEEDFLYPQPDDQFTMSYWHTETVMYLKNGIDIANRDRDGFYCVNRLGIDWQTTGMRPNAPDLVVFENFPKQWDRSRYILPVVDSGAKPVLVIEVTVASTRHLDLKTKMPIYFEAGVPYYLIFDWPTEPGSRPVLHAYRRSENGFVPLSSSERGVWIEPVRLGFAVVEGNVVAYREDGRRVLTTEEKADLYTAMMRTKEATARADAEKQRADAEKARADELARELADLTARLASNG